VVSRSPFSRKILQDRKGKDSVTSLRYPKSRRPQPDSVFPSRRTFLQRIRVLALPNDRTSLGLPCVRRNTEIGTKQRVRGGGVAEKELQKEETLGYEDKGRPLMARRTITGSSSCCAVFYALPFMIPEKMKFFRKCACMVSNILF
jgi:hypothetical protein